MMAATTWTCRHLHHHDVHESGGASTQPDRHGDCELCSLNRNAALDRKMLEARYWPVVLCRDKAVKGTSQQRARIESTAADSRPYFAKVLRAVRWCAYRFEPSSTLGRISERLEVASACIYVFLTIANHVHPEYSLQALAASTPSSQTSSTTSPIPMDVSGSKGTSFTELCPTKR